MKAPSRWGRRLLRSSRLRRLSCWVIHLYIRFVYATNRWTVQGGEVRVTCGATADGRAEVSVTDQGVGIAAEDQDRLFTRFGRIVTSANSHIPGTGLGLYLARELARMHGGEIRAESEEGVGSTFTLTVPVIAGQPERIETAAAD